MNINTIVQEREAPNEITHEPLFDTWHLEAQPGLLALEGQQVVSCPTCRREHNVWWFVDIDGLVTFGIGPVVGDEHRYRQWLEQNRPLHEN